MAGEESSLLRTSLMQVEQSSEEEKLEPGNNQDQIVVLAQKSSQDSSFDAEQVQTDIHSSTFVVEKEPKLMERETHTRSASVLENA